MPRRFLLPLALALLVLPARAADGNRLAYLDTNEVYYPSRTFPKLTTPQWVGEEGVDAVVVLAIDDMRGHAAWERYLRPILERLKKIDGRAPVSIMTCSIDPKEPHLQKWLAEGLSLETHTIDHPCPLLGRMDLEGARSTCERCIDMLAAVPGSRPVAFRTPCCDSMNTVSPRFYSEIFNRPTAKGNFLRLDSSVFNLITPDDPELPRDLVFDGAGRDRFRKHLPRKGTFVNLIHDYPYPYVINRLCWEVPCATPSDCQGGFQIGNASPTTLADMKAGLDAVVRKKGVYAHVFHPYAWMRNDQVVELIDHAVARHGKRVRFLTFREVHERLTKNLLGGVPLRAADGSDNGVRLLDIDGDGYVDAVIANEKVRQTRLWDPRRGRWNVLDFPAVIAEPDGSGRRRQTGVQFGVLQKSSQASFLVRNGGAAALWHFAGGRWVKDEAGLRGLELAGAPIHTALEGKDRGVRLLDIDGDGVCELVVGNDKQSAVFGYRGKSAGWQKLPFALPEGTAIVDGAGRDRGLRFVDLDEDGTLDIICSNEERYSLDLFASPQKGWSRRVLAGKAGEAAALPAIARRGSDNGAWFADRHLWVQNEHTAKLPDLLDRRSFNDLLASVDPGPRSPAASLRCLKARPGFAVEQVAAEPLVFDPVAFAWGPDGKLWVVEMGDYPLGIDGKGKPGGKVVYLESSMGDGRYDRRTVFLDNLPFPTGVLPWRKGVLVTCAPDIFYAECTKGSGKADRRETLFTGFREGNQQHRVNTLAWGLDNWLHVANGDSGGVIRSLKTNKVVDISGRDVRIRPDTGEIDAQTGQTQFGRSRDDWGNWFGGNNSVPMVHYVLPDQYMRRNVHFAVREARVQVPEVPGAAPVFPRSRTLPRFNDPGAANRFTSACSPVVYRDDLFGPHFSASLFVSEPVHNLVHREVISPLGVTFRGARAAEERTSEFLASSDNWFRPTTVQTGPDGALWVASMYRAVIEHPQWIPPEVQKRLDLRAGHDRGRIYRAFPVGAAPRAIPRLDGLDTAGLVAALESPSGWQRDTAQQMLLWRRDPAAVAPLEKLARSPRPLARLHALCTLDGLDALKPGVLVKALSDPHPGVRRHAVRLCETRLGPSPELGKALLARLDDDDLTVRLQLAFTLGEWKDERAGRALGQILKRDSGDRFVYAAVMSSLSRNNLDAVLQAALEGLPPPELIVELMRQTGAMGLRGTTATLLRHIAAVPKGEPPGSRLDLLAGLLDGLEQRGSSLAALGKENREAMRGVAELFTYARRTAGDEAQPEAERLRCLRLLGRGGDRRKEDRELLGSLLGPRVPEAVQVGAVAALARLRSREAPELLLRGWKSHGPRLRAAVLDALLQRPAWLPDLLAALESKTVLALELDAARRQRLLAHRDEAIRKRAAKLLADAVSPDRQKVIDSYREALTRLGDPGRGKAVFGKVCASCHRLAGAGSEVGPDLAALSGKSAEYLLIAILDPNRAVEARYINYQATLLDGRIFAGILAAETGNSITLLGADGKPRVILRRSLESLSSTGQSLMPEGLEKDMPVAAMADLLAFVQSQAPAARPKAFPGNKPEEVHPDKDGVLRLRAINAEIYGPSLVLEAKYGNLGWWSHADDRAVWTALVPAAGAYEVWLDHACDGGAAGNVLLLEGDKALLAVKVGSTGSWDAYRQVNAGKVKLPAGRVRLTVRSKGPVRGALIDLRELRLVPARP
jgi:putative membrane-bound dehydrogenase-like protein